MFLCIFASAASLIVINFNQRTQLSLLPYLLPLRTQFAFQPDTLLSFNPIIINNSPKTLSLDQDLASLHFDNSPFQQAFLSIGIGKQLQTGVKVFLGSQKLNESWSTYAQVALKFGIYSNAICFGSVGSVNRTAIVYCHHRQSKTNLFFILNSTNVLKKTQLISVQGLSMQMKPLSIGRLRYFVGLTVSQSGGLYSVYSYNQTLNKEYQQIQENAMSFDTNLNRVFQLFSDQVKVLQFDPYEKLFKQIEVIAIQSQIYNLIKALNAEAFLLATSSTLQLFDLKISKAALQKYQIPEGTIRQIHINEQWITARTNTQVYLFSVQHSYPVQSWTVDQRHIVTLVPLQNTLVFIKANLSISYRIQTPSVKINQLEGNCSILVRASNQQKSQNFTIDFITPQFLVPLQVQQFPHLLSLSSKKFIGVESYVIGPLLRYSLKAQNVESSEILPMPIYFTNLTQMTSVIDERVFSSGKGKVFRYAQNQTFLVVDNCDQLQFNCMRSYAYFKNFRTQLIVFNRENSCIAYANNNTMMFLDVSCSFGLYTVMLPNTSPTRALQFLGSNVLLITRQDNAFSGYTYQKSDQLCRFLFNITSQNGTLFYNQSKFQPSIIKTYGLFIALQNNQNVLLLKFHQAQPLLISKISLEGCDFQISSKGLILVDRRGPVRVFDIYSTRLIKSYQIQLDVTNYDFNAITDMLVLSDGSSSVVIDLKASPFTQPTYNLGVASRQIAGSHNNIICQNTSCLLIHKEKGLLLENKAEGQQQFIKEYQLQYSISNNAGSLQMKGVVQLVSAQDQISTSASQIQIKLNRTSQISFDDFSYFNGTISQFQIYSTQPQHVTLAQHLRKSSQDLFQADAVLNLDQKSTWVIINQSIIQYSENGSKPIGNLPSAMNCTSAYSDNQLSLLGCNNESMSMVFVKLQNGIFLKPIVIEAKQILKVRLVCGQLFVMTRGQLLGFQLSQTGYSEKARLSSELISETHFTDMTSVSASQLRGLILVSAGSNIYYIQLQIQQAGWSLKQFKKIGLNSLPKAQQYISFESVIVQTSILNYSSTLNGQSLQLFITLFISGSQANSLIVQLMFQSTGQYPQYYHFQFLSAVILQSFVPFGNCQPFKGAAFQFIPQQNFFQAIIPHSCSDYVIYNYYDSKGKMQSRAGVKSQISNKFIHSAFLDKKALIPEILGYSLYDFYPQLTISIRNVNQKTNQINAIVSASNNQKSSNFSMLLTFPVNPGPNPDPVPGKSLWWLWTLIGIFGAAAIIFIIIKIKNRKVEQTQVQSEDYQRIN